MEKNRVYCFFLALALFVPGRSNSNHLKTLEGIGIGPRALGMGGAFVALVDDPTSVYWNPAGLAFVENPTLYGEISARQRSIVDHARYIGHDSFSDFAGPPP